jgi:phosphoribosylformimino-5-aminoimidazole carboxamide ribotide isomerase
MKVFPAIDLLDGKAVRLQEGRRDSATIYHDDPPALVAALAAAGAERIHVVDLDGAFHGARHHHDLVGRIIAASPVPVQVGGGIRSYTDVEAVIAHGARYVVLGTAAVKHPEMVQEMCHAHPGRIVVAVDARDGQVAIEGWVEASEVTAIDLARRAEDWGACAVLYTDVRRDGMHTGPNVEQTAALARAVSIDVIASGGVTRLDDLRALALAGVPACIVGRALYDRHFTLEEAIAAARC